MEKVESIGDKEWFKSEPEIRGTLIDLEVVNGIPFMAAQEKMTEGDLAGIRSLVGEYLQLDIEADARDGNIRQKDIIERLDNTFRRIVERV